MAETNPYTCKLPTASRYPKTVGGQIDLAYELRELRRLLSQRAEAIAKIEDELTELATQAILKERSTGSRGSVAQLSVSTSLVPSIEDFGEVVRFAARKGNEDLLRHQLNTAAARARHDDGKEVPGVKWVSVLKKSLTKLGAKR